MASRESDPAPATLVGTPAAPLDPLFAALVESAEDAIFTKRLDGTITTWNHGAERIYGYSASQVVGRSVAILAPPENPDEIPAILARLASGQRIDHFETVRIRRDGSRRDVSLTISPIRDRGGDIIGASTIARDITEQKTADNQRLQAQKLESIGRLAGGIAHDFNNMLFAIRGHAELLAEDLSPERRSELDLDEILSGVAAISNAAERASVLTAQLLAFSRQQVVDPKVVALNTGILGMEPMLRKLIAENVNLVFKLDPTAGNVKADPGQLDQILVNLVVNARDAMPNGGTVTIETANVVVDEPYALQHVEVSPGPYVVLVVSDTGVGMDRETREHIFEPFFTTKGPGKGTGLGLATIYGIVRQAGGHIWLYSEPGLGSSFKLHFPRVDAPAPADTKTRAGAQFERSGVVVVVEDEPAVRDMTRLLLKRAGYEVVAVADSATALAEISALSEPIDVLVTDVIMPNVSGLDLAEQVMDRFPQVGVVLLSGYTSETLDVDRIVGRGALFVPKPITRADLLDAIERARITRT
jgi:PAS domain S-box-containing protein